MTAVNDFRHTPCSVLPGVGRQICAKLAVLHIVTLYDLLLHLPLRYEDHTHVQLIAEVAVGQQALIDVVITAVNYPTTGKTKLLCEVRDLSRQLQLRFFHLVPSYKNILLPGVRLLCFGEMRMGPTGLEMTHPNWQILRPSQPVPLAAHLTPVYPTTANLSQKLWRKLIQQTLQLWQHDNLLPDLLPVVYRVNQQLPSLRESLLLLHQPPSTVPMALLLAKQHPAQRRLFFEELLAYRLHLLQKRMRRQQYQAPAMVNSGDAEQHFLAALPYALTSAQDRVIAEIKRDLALNKPMLRLVQGDVGSGKTVVAAVAALQVVANCCQVVIMVPTELLAEQHYRVLRAWLAPLQLHVVLLTSQLSSKERNLIRAEIANGQAQVVVGTHALLQEQVVFAQLGLIVVDEQHRFGVQQRALLRAKGVSDGQAPHQLIMTATPIPRTLALCLYADLDCSVIDELPPGRQPVQTQVIPNTRRAEVIARVAKACSAGRQAYWVCPIILATEALSCQAVAETAELLQHQLPELRIALLHGRLPASDREKIMRYFAAGDIDLLVATTIIEVGVDVPKASLMIIENAERLGLAQLHQLRGRIGRGSVASYCVLLYQEPLSPLAQQRLIVTRNNNDGFKIAEYDLQLRGPGDLFGLRQAGDIALRLAELPRDYDLLPLVASVADDLMRNHPSCVVPLLQRWRKPKLSVVSVDGIVGSYSYNDEQDSGD
jgi:ATP-dependent DNA helicase RecG